MIISLVFFKLDNSRFLEQVTSYFGPVDIFHFVEVNLDIFPEPTGIIITSSFAVTESLKNGIAAEDFLFNWMLIRLTQRR